MKTKVDQDLKNMHKRINKDQKVLKEKSWNKK
jgi:hypothetical protein